MSRYRKIFNRIFTSIFLVVLLSINVESFAQDGEALFKANCAACHKPDKDFTGPALTRLEGQGAGRRLDLQMDS